METTEKIGPRVTTTRSCRGCHYLVSRYYAHQGDSGYDYSCRHPLGRRNPNDEPLVRATACTPDWCPELPAEGESSTATSLIGAWLNGATGSQSRSVDLTRQCHLESVTDETYAWTCKLVQNVWVSTEEISKHDSVYCHGRTAEEAQLGALEKWMKDHAKVAGLPEEKNDDGNDEQDHQLMSDEEARSILASEGIDPDAAYERLVAKIRSEDDAEARLKLSEALFEEMNERCELLESAIREALEAAGGRWSEWGDRALSVAEILEGALDR